MEWDLSSIVPDNVTPEEAASIPIPFLTAVQALYLRLKIPEPPRKLNGEWIIIWSGVCIQNLPLPLFLSNSAILDLTEEIKL